jgi:response regulator RpfG family c-di-GMP phosphodiesterase
MAKLMQSNATTSINFSILIATDLISDAQIVKSMLIKEYACIAVSSSTTKADEYFEASRPDVLILAFSLLKLAEHYYMKLYRFWQAIQAKPRRTIVLGDQPELPRTYQCFREGHVDDYVLF